MQKKKWFKINILVHLFFHVSEKTVKYLPAKPQSDAIYESWLIMGRAIWNFPVFKSTRNSSLFKLKE